MKIVFFGSDHFAATSLERLIRDGYDVCAVVTQPDRPRGRGMKVSLLPVKMFALEQGISVLQPEDLNDENFMRTLADYEADLFIVIAYGKFLPKTILEMPKVFCINVHGSLLPKYRGAAPINWAIINGDKQTGISVIKMNEAMDAGEIILQKAVDISHDSDALTLREHMADVGAQCLCEAIDFLKSGQYQLMPQEASEVSFAPQLTRQQGGIDWGNSAEDIYNQVRGLVPWPAAFTVYRGKRLKILQTRVVEQEGCLAEPGEVMSCDLEGFSVACGKGSLLIQQVHFESSKPMDARSFSVGHGVATGVKFAAE